jgi:anti-sigma factor RsiW
MIGCDDFRRLKHAHLDGELDEAATAQLRAHASRCAQCAEELRASERLRALLCRSAAEEPTQATLGRVRAVLAAAAEAEAARTRSDPPAIMTLGEVATYLRVSATEARRLAHQIPHFLVAGRLRFRRQMVERWIETQEQRPAAAAVGPVLRLAPDEGAAWALAG